MMKNKVFFGVVLALLMAVVPASSLSKEKSKAKNDTVVLSSDNLIVLNDEVNGESVGKVIAKAKELSNAQNSGLRNKLKLGKKDCKLVLFLYTPGGSIQSGLELEEALNGLDCKVDTITLFAASMGFQIAQALGDRLILKNGALMSHRAAGQFEGEFGGQSPSQLDNRYALWKERMDELDRQTVERSKGKQTMESYQKQYSSEMWLTGTQSVAQGYADRIVKVRCDETLTGTSKHELMFLGLIKINYELDNCPINTAPMNVSVGFITTRGYMSTTDFLNQGGTFGPGCLVNNPNGMNLCALDTSLNLDKISGIKSQFMSFYEKKQKQVVPYRW